MTWNQWLYWANLQLKTSTSPQRDAEIILSKIINKSRVQLLAFGETLLNYNEISALESLISRRMIGEPIAYLIGEKEFWSLNFKISSGVFIPRPDTECLVEKVLNLLSMSHLDVLDLGTGVGTIALALASERPNWNITGTDIQKKALILAKHNQYSFNLNNVKFIYGNWFTCITNKKFDLIVSNPPYISSQDSYLLTKNMTFEPREALISDDIAGLSDLTIICQQSIQHLHPQGWLILEHGWNQGKYMKTLFNKLGFVHTQTIYDYHNYARVTYGQRPFY